MRITLPKPIDLRISPVAVMHFKAETEYDVSADVLAELKSQQVKFTKIKSGDE